MSDGVKIAIGVVGAAAAAYFIAQAIKPSVTGKGSLSTTNANLSQQTAFLGGLLGSFASGAASLLKPTTQVSSQGLQNVIYPGAGTYSQAADQSLVIQDGNSLYDLNTGDTLVFGTD